MSSDDFRFAKTVLERVKQSRSLKTDTQLAEYLDVGTSTVATWKRRDSLDFRLIVSKCKDLDLNWLFLGEAKSWAAPHPNRELEAENARLHKEVTSLEGKIEGLREALRLMGRGGRPSEAERRRSGEEETGFTATEGADAGARDEA